MRKYALVNNNVITQIIEIEPEELCEYSGKNSLIIDITDFIPQPQLNWVLVGNILEFPQGNSDREKLEEILAEKKIIFGIKLARMCVIKIGARNKILNKNSTQVSTILNQLIGVKLLLENGALGTARDSCSLLKAVFSEYSDIFDKIIAEVNSFEISNGL